MLYHSSAIPHRHQHRPSTYSPFDYFGEFGVVVQAIGNDSSIPVRDNLIAPSVSGTWSPEDIWNTGFIPSYSSQLGSIAVEQYAISPQPPRCGVTI